MSVLTTAVRRTASWHRPLMIFTGVLIVLTVAAGLGVLTDDRILGGAPVWLKPFKFAISFVIYCASMAWIISRLPHRRRWAWALGTVILASTLAELVIIFTQAGRGTYSHFNVTTSLDAALWFAMGGFAVVIWLATLVVAGFAACCSFGDRAGTLAIRLGLALALVGMALGFLMTSPTADQGQALSQGATTLVGAHSVGVPDGGPGLPLTAWSTTGGDLRVPHFVGMHALQALPLLGWLFALPRFGLAERTRSRLVVTGATGYLGLVVLLLWQALRGQPVTAPDAVTLSSLAVLVALVAVVVATILASARRSAPAPEMTT